MDAILIDINKVQPNTGQLLKMGVPANPRTISEEKFKKLCNSIESCPELTEMRGLIVYPLGTGYVTLGGNMRLKAYKELKWDKVPCYILPENLPPRKLKEIIIQDNNEFGENDWDALKKDWSMEDLKEWGVDVLEDDADMEEKTEENIYTKKIELPPYEPKNEKPLISEMVDTSKTDEMVNRIKAAKIPKDVKDFLIKAAGRHTVFNYEKIADFYAHSDKELQELMEESALVIIDFQKAIENGFVKVTKDLQELYDIDHPDDE